MYWKIGVFVCFCILPSEPPTLTYLKCTKKTLRSLLQAVKLANLCLTGLALSLERVTAVFTTGVWMQGHSISMTEAGEQSNHICINVVQLDNWLAFFYWQKTQGLFSHRDNRKTSYCNGQNKTQRAEQPVRAAMLKGSSYMLVWEVSSMFSCSNDQISLATHSERPLVSEPQPVCRFQHQQGWTFIILLLLS